MLITDGGGGSRPSSMALQVAPKDLIAAAQSFGAAANKAQAWLNTNAHDLNVMSAGADQVSEEVSTWLTDNATGVMGAVPAVQAAIKNLAEAADSMRQTAASYGVTEDNVTAAITSAATS